MQFWYGSGSSDPYLCLTDPDADLGGPKIYGSFGSGSGCGSGSTTLVFRIFTRISYRQFFGISAGPDLAAYLNEDPGPDVTMTLEVKFFFSFFAFSIFNFFFLHI